METLGQTPAFTAPAVISKSPEASPLPPPVAGNRRGRPKGRKWENLSGQEQIEWVVKTLELKAQSGGALSNASWKEHIKKDFGGYSLPLGRSLRSVVARTSKSFRPEFEERIRKTFGDRAKPYLDRLAKL